MPANRPDSHSYLARLLKSRLHTLADPYLFRAAAMAAYHMAEKEAFRSQMHQLDGVGEPQVGLSSLRGGD